MRIAICGYAEHGKGTAAAFITLKTRLRYRESTSEAASRLIIFPALAEKYGYRTPREAWLDRKKHRDEWAKLIWDYNLSSLDGLRLYHDMMPDNDVLEGIRKKGELQALQESGFVQLTVWVDASQRKPPEPVTSCQISAVDCNVVIDNNGDVEHLRTELNAFIDRYLSQYKRDNKVRAKKPG